MKRIEKLPDEQREIDEALSRAATPSRISSYIKRELRNETVPTYRPRVASTPREEALVDFFDDPTILGYFEERTEDTDVEHSRTRPVSPNSNPVLSGLSPEDESLPPTEEFDLVKPHLGEFGVRFMTESDTEDV